MLAGPIGKLPRKANRAVALVASANRAADLFAVATRAVALFATGNLQFVAGDLGKSVPGFSKANSGSYGPPI